MAKQHEGFEVHSTHGVTRPAVLPARKPALVDADDESAHESAADTEKQRRERAAAQQLPECTPTAAEMVSTFAAQNAANKQIILKRLAREYPAVRELIAENAALKAKVPTHRTK
jgi:hypothetical protein